MAMMAMMMMMTMMTVMNLGGKYLPRITFLLVISLEASKGVSSCPHSQLNGRCYKVISKPTPFNSVYEARQMCLNDGWDVVGISTEQENEFIARLIHNSTFAEVVPSLVYIGLSDVEEQKTFRWLNGLPVTFTNYPESALDTHFYGDDRRCFAISSPGKNWQTSNSTDLTWTVVPCCFPYQGIRHVACSNYKIGTNRYSSLQAYCIGNCSSDWLKYKDNCYLLSQPRWSSTNATSSRKDCLEKGADLVSISRNNDLFVNFLVESTLNSRNVKSLNFFLGFHKPESPPNFDGTELSPNLQESKDVLYHSSNASLNRPKNCTVYWSTASRSEEPCCHTLPVAWRACQKPETSSVSVDLDSDVLAKECYGNINECSSDPCQNGATCVDHVQYYNCTCTSGFTGRHCETPIQPCNPSPCQNNGTCQAARSGTGYKCTCPDGFNGTNCETQWNLCLSSPCQNNGTCSSFMASKNPDLFDYKCQCPPSSTGKNCETDTINECSSNPCQMSSTCVNLINRYRCDCVPGYTGRHCDTVVACTNLTFLVQNADEIEVTGSGTSFGDTRHFRCHPEFQFSDMSTEKVVFCTEESQWNDTKVHQGCLESCAFLPVVHNSTVFNASTAVNSSTKFECYTGHAVNGNITEVTFTCLQDKTWSPPTTLMACQPRRCPTLPLHRNQHLDRTDDIYGTTVRVWCDPGYQFYDNTTARTVKCKASGDWTGALPPCEPLTCPELTLNPHTSRNTSLSTYLTYALYTCDPNHRMLDGSQYKVIMCDAAGEWSDDVTDCARDRCFPLPYVANATPSTTKAIHWTQSILTCVPGHKFKMDKEELSSAIMTCQENGWWSPILTSCEPIFCPELSIVRKNMTRNTESRLYGTVVTLKCFEGHYIDASTFLDTFHISCQDTQEWNDTDIPSCSPIQCPDPPAVPASGVRSPLTSTVHFFPEVVSYTCNHGTKFIDGQKSKNIHCNEVGVWNETDMSCKSERCESLVVLPNSYPDTVNTSWYATTTYYCNRGHYRVDGRPYYAVKCEAGGVWNDTYDATKDCIIKSCPPVETFQNSVVNSTSVTFYGTTLEYKCRPGHKYSEDDSTVKYRRCNEDALWIPSNFSDCEIVYCPSLPSINNTIKSSNDTHYNTVVNYTCLSGYQFPDRTKVKMVTCSENETWTELPEPCDVIFCPPLPTWSETSFTTTDNNFDSYVEYHCKEGSSFKNHKNEPGNRTILSSRCVATKQWNPPVETCYALNSISSDIKGKSWESPNAASLGTVACAIMCVVLVMVFAVDVRKVWMDLKMMRGNVKEFLAGAKKNKVTPRS